MQCIPCSVLSNLNIDNKGRFESKRTTIGFTPAVPLPLQSSCHLAPPSLHDFDLLAHLAVAGDGNGAPLSRNHSTRSGVMKVDYNPSGAGLLTAGNGGPEDVLLPLNEAGPCLMGSGAEAKHSFDQSLSNLGASKVCKQLPPPSAPTLDGQQARVLEASAVMRQASVNGSDQGPDVTAHIGKAIPRCASSTALNSSSTVANQSSPSRISENLRQMQIELPGLETSADGSAVQATSEDCAIAQTLNVCSYASALEPDQWQSKQQQQLSPEIAEKASDVSRDAVASTYSGCAPLDCSSAPVLDFHPGAKPAAGAFEAGNEPVAVDQASRSDTIESDVVPSPPPMHHPSGLQHQAACQAHPGPASAEQGGLGSVGTAAAAAPEHRTAIPAIQVLVIPGKLPPTEYLEKAVVAAEGNRYPQF